MLHYKAISESALELLKQLQATPLFSNLRLVGGTSLALQIGHRLSVDLDLFGEIGDDVLEINKSLESLGTVTQIKNSKHIHIYLINGIKVDIVNYTYPWLAPPVLHDDLVLADVKDIAAMKIAAVTGRGSKKDFIDIYFLLQQMKFGELMRLYAEKYHDGSAFMALKSIVYFDDAEEDAMPDMFIKTDWQYVKAEIQKQYTRYMNEA